MGIKEYQNSQRLAVEVSNSDGNEFYSLLMAAIRFADTDNLEKLESVFPEVANELWARYKAPGGVLVTDNQKPVSVVYRRIEE